MGEGEVVFGEPAGVMRRQGQRDLAVADHDVGMMLHLLGEIGDAADSYRACPNSGAP